jgi:hypothetical protein
VEDDIPGSKQAGSGKTLCTRLDMIIRHPKHEHVGPAHLPEFGNGSSGTHERHTTARTCPGATEHVANFEHPLFMQKSTNGPGNMPASDDIESLHTSYPSLLQRKPHTGEPIAITRNLNSCSGQPVAHCSEKAAIDTAVNDRQKKDEDNLYDMGQTGTAMCATVLHSII